MSVSVAPPSPPPQAPAPFKTEILWPPEERKAAQAAEDAKTAAAAEASTPHPPPQAPLPAPDQKPADEAAEPASDDGVAAANSDHKTSQEAQDVAQPQVSTVADIFVSSSYLCSQFYLYVCLRNQ